MQLFLTLITQHGSAELCRGKGRKSHEYMQCSLHLPCALASKTIFRPISQTSKSGYEARNTHFLPKKQL
jgi:hypothetical protein